MSYSTQSTKMGTWKTRVIEKKAKGRQTTGREKGIVTTPLERTICRRNRSWKNSAYSLVMPKLNGEKRRKGK